jgi:hypothetical protein
MPRVSSSRRASFLLPVWCLAVLVTLAAAGLHFYFFQHAGGLWRDEVHLVHLAGQNSLAALAHDSFPVLTPVCLRFWEASGFGKTDFALRLFGLLIGLGLPAALWLAAWKFHRSPPLAGLALLALNSTVIVFGDAVRPHGLGSLLILLAFIATAWLLKKPSWPRAGLAALLATLSVQTLFQNAVFVAAICFAAWAVCLRQKNRLMARHIFFIAAVAASSLLPYQPGLVSLQSGAATLRTGLEPARLLANVDTALGFPMQPCRWLWLGLTLLMLAAAGTFFSGRKSPPENLLSTRWLPWSVAAIAATGLVSFLASPATYWWIFPVFAVFTLWFDGDKLPAETIEPTAATTRDLAWFSSGTVLFAAAGFAAFTWLAALPTESWYFLPLLALAAGSFEIGLPARGQTRAAILGYSAVMAFTAGIVAFADQKTVNWRFTNIDLLCEKLSSQTAAGDLVLVSPWYCGMTFERYFTNAVAWQTVPPLADHSLARYDLIHAAMRQPKVNAPLLERATETLRAGHHVWIAGMLAVPAAGQPVPADLPPPPLPHSGWSDRPYALNWLEQMDQSLRNHSREFKLVYETAPGNLNFMENLQLYRVAGWQE